MLSVDSIGSWNEEKGNSETTKGKVNERTTIKKTSHLVTLIFPCVRIIAFNLGLPSIGLLPFYGLLRWHYFLFRIGGSAMILGHIINSIYRIILKKT